MDRANSEPPALRRARIVVNDYHMGEGLRFPNGKLNVREEFTQDHAYVDMLRAVLRRYPADAEIELHWNGDMVDFQAIRYRGRYRHVATEEASLERLEACIAGHAPVFRATAAFLRDPRTTMVITVGNHDHDFVWPRVQERLKDMFDPGGGKVRFIFDEQVDDVYFMHGDVLDPVSTIPAPEDSFITDKVGGGRPMLLSCLVLLCTFGTVLGMVTRRKDITFTNFCLVAAAFLAGVIVLGWLIRKAYFRIWKDKKFLNVTWAYVMNSTLGMWLKWLEPWIGRMKNHGPIWWLHLARSWSFGFIAGPLLLANFFYHRFFIDYLNVRKKVSLRRTLEILLGTMRPGEMGHLLKKVAAKHPNARYLVYGHTHNAEIRKLDLGDRIVVCYDNGTAVEQVRLIKPEVACTTSWPPRLEAFFRRIGLYWRKKPRSAVGLTVLHFALAPALVWLAWYLELPVSAVLIVVVSIVSLFFRQSYALHDGERYTEFTPLEIRIFSDGSKNLRLLKYDPAADEFSGYLDS